MKKTLSILMACAVLATITTGCSSGGVSQEEYDKVVAERDALKEQYGVTDVTVSDDSSSAASDTSNANTQNSSDFDEQAVLDKLKVTEYSYKSGSSPWVFLVVENTSDFTLDIRAALKTYDSSNNMLAAKDYSEYAIGKGAKTIFSFCLDEDYAKTEYELTPSLDTAYESVVQDLTYTSTPAKNKEVLSVTNASDQAADFVEAHVLFFKGNTLIKHSTAYFTDDDSELKAGATITKEMPCYDEYDSYQVYFTGRR